MKTQVLRIICSISLFVISISVSAQGPQLSYFHNTSTQLPWASCYIYFEKGSKQKIGFFPVINEKTNAPMGIENYSKDVNIDKGLIFLNVNLADTLNSNIENMMIEDKIIMLYNYSSNTQGSSPLTNLLEEKIIYAIDKKAAAIVVISKDNSYPLFTVNLEKEIPVITITNKTAEAIFSSTGINYSEISKKNVNKITSLIGLPVNIKLHIDGEFSCIESERFNYRYLSNLLTQAEINQQKSINEKSVDFLLGLFKELKFEWSKENIYYFSNYDSKIFYTGYWGIGFSCDIGVYNVLFNTDASYSLSVHENTHSMLRKNSLTFNSFFNEGIARYAEAIATDKDLNNKKTFDLLTNGKLLSLEKMLEFNIGNNLNETEIAYPASGSFTEFLIEKYGLKIILKLNEKTNSFSKRDLINNEEEWLSWLKKKYN